MAERLGLQGGRLGRVRQDFSRFFFDPFLLRSKLLAGARRARLQPDERSLCRVRQLLLEPGRVRRRRRDVEPVRRERRVVPRPAVRGLGVERRVLPAARGAVREVRRAVLGVQDEPLPLGEGRRGALKTNLEKLEEEKKNKKK